MILLRHPADLNVAELHLLSTEKMAQHLISQYQITNMLESHSAASSSNNAMHILQQPTNEDSPLWVCKIKGCFFVAYFNITV